MRADARLRKADAITGRYPDEPSAFSGDELLTWAARNSKAAPLPPRYRKQSAGGPYILVGFRSGDQAMWIVLPTMVSLSALALLAACGDNLNNMP
jgi:hypothetical protein